MRRIDRLLIAAATALLPAPGFAQAVATPVAAGEVVVNMRDVEIANVAEQISRITGRTLILDPNVRGTVNVVSAEPLSPAGVWELFQAVLRVQGYVAVRSGAVWRIVPQATAVQGGAGADVRSARAQDVVTRLIRLRNLPSETAARVLRPLVASFGNIEALPAPNAIIVTDYAENVRRVESLAQSLDSGGGASFESITLSNASARDVGQSIQRILGDGSAAGGPRIAIDERSNVVLVRGDARMLAEARRVAAALDRPGGTSPITRMFRLRNSDAESVTEVLRGLMGGGSQVSNPVARSLARTGDSAAIGAGTTNRFDRPSSPTIIDTTPQPAGLAGGLPAPTIDGAEGASGFSVADVSIQPAPELNAIVARGSPAALASIDALIAQLDVRRPQVMIEAAIVEITGDAAEQLGVQLGFGAAAPVGGSAGATSFSNAGVSIRDILRVLGAPVAIGLGEGLTVGAGDRNDFGILVQALGQSTKANLLSTPSLTTLDNQPAEIVVGQNVPFRTGSFTTEGNTTNPFTTIEREDVGITLRVVPRVHEGDVVRLEVSQEVSSLVNANVVGAADLITNRRSIQTTVLADNSETIVLGGLITDDRLTARSQVPVLGDIPVLGALFRSERESQTRRTLFVFLRPTILRDRAAMVAAADAKYDRLREQERAELRTRSLLLQRTRPRLPLEIEGVY